MDIKKLAPWNWFKKEEEDGGTTIPVQRTNPKPLLGNGFATHPLVHLHREIERLFDNTFRGFDLAPFRAGVFTPFTTSGVLKPQVDISATEKEYSITVEVPGIDEKDVKVEIEGNTMTIHGEKRQEKEEEGKNYYKIERAYGSFRRVLSLPEDADHNGVKATFKNGVLTINMPRKELPKPEVRHIEIK